MGQRDQGFDRGSRGDDVEVELALEALLHDFHVQQAQEAAAETEAERHRGFRLEADGGVVEMQLLQGIAQHRVVGPIQRIDAREHEGLGRLVAGQRLWGRSMRRREGVADLAVADALEARRHVADLAGSE